MYDHDETDVDWPMTLRVMCSTICNDDPTEDPRMIDIADAVYSLAINRGAWRGQSRRVYSDWAYAWYIAITEDTWD